MVGSTPKRLLRDLTRHTSVPAARPTHNDDNVPGLTHMCIEPHSIVDVLCSIIFDVVAPKTMCASPSCPPPHTNMHHTVNTCVHRPIPRAHQHKTSPTMRIPHNLKHTTPRPGVTHKHHVLKARQSRVPPQARRDVLGSSIADGVVLQTTFAPQCPPPHTNMHHTVNTRVHRPQPGKPTQHFTNHPPPAQPYTHHATATRYTHKRTPRT